MASAPFIADEKDLKLWLEDKAPNWAELIAVRAALRVAPLAARSFEIKRPRTESAELLSLATFRALTVSWAAIRYDFDKRIYASSRAAAKSGDRLLESLARNRGTGRHLIAAMEAALAVGDEDHAPSHAAKAALAAASAAGNFAARLYSDSNGTEAKAAAANAEAATIWQSISADAALLEKNDVRFHEVASRKLWIGDPPAWVSVNLRSLFREWKKVDENSSVWNSWYSSRLHGHNSFKLDYDTSVKVDDYLSTVDSSWWSQNPKQINKEIYSIVLDYSHRSAPLRETIAEFIVSYLENRQEPARNDEIARAFAEAEYPVIPKTMRGQLSRLATSGIIRRVSYGVYAALSVPVDDDLFEDLDKRSNLKEVAEEILNYSETLPTGSPVVISGNFFSLGSKFGPSDLEIADTLSKNGRRDAVRRKVERLVAKADHRLRNYYIWDDLIETLPELEEWLTMTPANMVEHIGVGWELSVTVGRFIELDKKLAADSNSQHLPLEPDLRASLDDVNSSVGTFLREFPSGAALDDRHREWNASHENLELARSLFSGIEKTNVLLEQYIPLIARALNSEDLHSLHSRKSAGWGIGTVKRLGLASIVAASAITGGVIGGVSNEIGAEIARQNQLPDKAAKLVLRSKKELLEFSKDAPADIRNAVESLIRSIEQGQP